MFTANFFFKTLSFFFFRFLFTKFGNPKIQHRSLSNLYSGQSKHQKYPSLARRSDLSNKVLIFNVEGTLLKSSSLFPYFMLVAFEAGSIMRAFVLFLLYPLICLVGEEEMGLKIMVMVCFFGIKKDSFRVGSAVLPKFFLEDVGLEAFELVKKGGRKVAVSKNFPRLMIENFLNDYLEIDVVVGIELKTVWGYFVGLMEVRNKEMVPPQVIINQDDVIGICRSNRSPDDHQLFSHCKEICLVRKTDKRSWQQLPKDKYPKALVFHDGRLAIRPTPLTTLAVFMWVPFGFILALIRVIAALTLPYTLSIPILSFSGFCTTISEPKSSNISPLTSNQDPNKPKKGLLYVCNHRTLIDPLCLSFSLKKDITALTYSLSRMSEILSPIRTVRLTRNRDQDGKMMEKLLSQGDLVVCPEGTTCREPYLLRFSPLFSEMSDEIVPVALNTQVTMFYGTTAGGLKCLDPLFFLMNPQPSYTIQVLQNVFGLSSCNYHDGDDRKSRFYVANHVQSEIGKALGFECTMLTRRDKYLILAGNEGFTTSPASN